MVSDDDLDYYSQAILLDFEIKSVTRKRRGVWNRRNTILGR